MPSGKIFSLFRWPFAKEAEPKGDVPKVDAELMRDAVYSESLIYAGTSWPKYNPDAIMGLRGYDIYRRMMTDEQVKAVTRFKRDAITARQYYFDTKPTRTEEDNADEPGNDDSNKIPAGDEESARPVVRGDGNAAGNKQIQQTRARFDASPALQDEATGNGDQAGTLQPGQAEPGAEANGLIPESEDPKSAEEQELERRAAILMEGLNKMDGSFRDALNGIMTSMFTGFSLSEKVFKHFTFQGKTWVGIKHIRLKPFHSFKFYTDEFGNIEKVVQQWSTHQEVPISLDKFIHHVHNPEFDQHYGCSELRDAYRAYFSKDIAIRFMNIYLERMAGGFVTISVSPGAQNPSKAETAEIKTLLQNLSAKNGILLPAGLTAAITYPQRSEMYEKAISLYDKAIAKALLVPNLLGISEQGDTGSYSQSQTQLEAFLWTLDAEAARLEETINKQLFVPLCDINFGEGGPYPRFKFEPISDTLKLNIIRLWNDLVKGGTVTSTDSDEKHIRALMDFPDAGEPLDKPPPAPIAGQPGNTPQPGGPPQPGEPAIKPGQKTGEKPGQTSSLEPKGETIIGKGQMKTTVDKETFNRAAKRVDFAVIDNKGAQLSGTAATKLVEVFKESLEEIKAFVVQEDLFTNPDKIAEIKVSARFMTRARKIIEAALKGAWEAGSQHARKELNKAKRAPRFAVDTLRLQEEAAQKFLESRSYTTAGDLASNLKKKVTTVLYNGIKGGWALQEIQDRIEEEIGANVLPHAATAIRTIVFEAINEARYELFASPEMDGFVEALMFSAILDGRTTEICEHMDGKTYSVDSPVWESYTPPLHFNCRSLLIAITVDDKWQESSAPAIQPQEGFGGG